MLGYLYSNILAHANMLTNVQTSVQKIVNIHSLEDTADITKSTMS